MRVILGGIKQLFWNDGEKRLRMPIRLIVMAGLFPLAILAVDVGGAFFERGLAPVVRETAASGTLSVGVMTAYVLCAIALGRVIDRRALSDYGL